ncbi:hypothetical protein D3C78_1715470 [compost metagenome]
MQGLQRLVAHRAVEAAQGGLIGFRIGEQRAGRVQVTIGVAQAGECLYPGNQASGGIDNGLEDGEGLAIEHEGLQRAARKGGRRR